MLPSSKCSPLLYVSPQPSVYTVQGTTFVSLKIKIRALHSGIISTQRAHTHTHTHTHTLKWSSLSLHPSWFALQPPPPNTVTEQFCQKKQRWWGSTTKALGWSLARFGHQFSCIQNVAFELHLQGSSGALHSLGADCCGSG
jgi:hypothetical protein